MEENRKLTQEELIEADAYFNLASMLGKAIQAAAYQAKHPEYNPEVTVWNQSAGASASEEQDKAEDAAFASAAVQPEPEISSNEGSIENQIDQLVALFYPAVFNLLSPSALWSMFRLAEEQFSFELTDPGKELSQNDKRKAAIAWIITKRVFAVRHPDETLYILNLTDAIRGDEIRGVAPPVFRPIDKTDEEMIVETCGLFVDDFEDTSIPPESFFAEKLAQLKQSNVITSPTSLAFWHQSEAAATGISKKTGAKKIFRVPNVYTKPAPANVDLVISDKEGNPLNITGFDMALQATIGQMIRENDNKPVQATPAQLFRKCAGLDADASVSAASIEETIASINKMRQADATISYAEQLDIFLKRTGKDKKGRQTGFDYSVSKIEGKLIAADRSRTAYVAGNGKIVDDVFIFYRAPILEHYSYGFKQLMEVDKKYLAGALNKATPENISFARYILVQINRMKRTKEKKKIPASETYTESLSFETIAARCLYDISSRQKLRNFQAKVYSYCENLVTLELIQCVEQQYKGRTYTGILISV